VLQTQTATTDRQLDNLVYELYGLTPEEIKIVENAGADPASSGDADQGPAAENGEGAPSAPEEIKLVADETA
jgi:hypothetical protein